MREGIAEKTGKLAISNQRLRGNRRTLALGSVSRSCVRRSISQS